MMRPAELIQHTTKEKYVNERIIGRGLRAGAVIINKLGTVLAPRLGLDVYPHRLWATGKTWGHLDVYRDGPGSACVEAGGWTVDVCWKVREEVAVRA